MAEIVTTKYTLCGKIIELLREGGFSVTDVELGAGLGLYLDGVKIPSHFSAGNGPQTLRGNPVICSR